MDSKHARQGKARHTWYYVGPGNRFLIPIHGKHERPATIVIEHLAAAFRHATERFFADIEQDAELEKKVWPRAERYYDEVRAHGRPGDPDS